MSEEMLFDVELSEGTFDGVALVPNELFGPLVMGAEPGPEFGGAAVIP